jgi:Holliday junction resolvase RusA-like endonuclease
MIVKNEFCLSLNPVPKPRMTQSDVWKNRKCVTDYWSYKEEINRVWQNQVEHPWDLIFILPMPKSWSLQKKQAHDNQPHQNRPDIDNLIKGFFDAVLEEDSIIYQIKASKYWGYTGAIVVRPLKVLHL